MEYFPSHMIRLYLKFTRKKVEWHLQFSPTGGNVWFSRSLLLMVQTIFRFNGMFWTIIVHTKRIRSARTTNWIPFTIDAFLNRSMCSVKNDILIIILIGSIDLCWRFSTFAEWNWNSHNRSIKIEEGIKSFGHFSCIAWNLLNQFSTFTNTF